MWWMVVLGVLSGALILNLLDLVTPHLHSITGLDAEAHKNNQSLNKILLFVMAIAIHKLPEGMAAGVSMNGSESASWTVSLGIALQNIPEGMVIIAPLLLAGVSRLRTLFIAIAIGLLEIVGVWIGFGLGALSATLLPVMLGFAGGAMLYVTSDEMIPETHAHGYQKQATYALLLGFMTLVIIEKLFH
jgi:ZIP family zinc transporter